MTKTTHTRVRYTRRKVEHCRSDFEDWKRCHEELERDCFVWEDLVVRTNELYHEIRTLENEVRSEVAVGQAEHDPELDNKLWSLIAFWLEIAEGFLPEVSRIEKVYGSATGGVELRKYVAEVRSLLAPSDTLFAGDQRPFPERSRGPLSERDAVLLVEILDDPSPPCPALLKAATQFKARYG